MRSPMISVIIPAFEEEKTLANVLSKTISVMDSTQLPWEIIVVDDGSKDGTLQEATRHKVAVLSNGKNEGKGYALRKGFENAKGDIIVTMDSDGEHDPKDIPALIAPLFNGSDVSTGSRYLGDGRDSTYRLNRMGNFIFNTAITVITGKRVTDSQSGFRAIKQEALKNLNLVSSGYEIETEITIKSLKQGLVFHEHPIRYTKRKYNTSKLRTLNDGVEIFKTILKATFTN